MPKLFGEIKPLVIHSSLTNDCANYLWYDWNKLSAAFCSYIQNNTWKCCY